MSYTIKEFARTGGVSIGGGKSTVKYQVNIDDIDDLHTLFTDFLGGTSTEVGDGRISRTPPLADPVTPWMYASSIPTYTPRIGIAVPLEIDEELEVPAVDEFNFFDWWEVHVEFTPRKFAIALDDDVEMISSSWYPDINTDSTGDQQTFKYADETIRYTTEPKFQSAFEYVTAQQGAMKFLTNGASFGSPAFSPNGKVFPAKLKMLLPDQVMKVTIMAMPYRFFTSSKNYYNGGTARAPWIGRLNQNPMIIAGYRFPAGSLQYLNYEPEEFSPPVPDREQLFPGVISSEKWMNMTLTFRVTNRKITDNTAAPTNRNYIQQGMNCQPWVLSGKYHYAVAASGVPSWLSAPLELLLGTDPDFAQTIG